MASAKLTLIGFNRYLKNMNRDLFENLVVPEGINKSTLTDNILLEGGEFEVLYSDPEFLQLAIGIWSNKYAPTFERWVNVLSMEYNPLENYDRKEDWSDKTEGSGSSSTKSTSERTLENTNNIESDVSIAGSKNSKETNLRGDSNGNNLPTHETKVSAFDSTDYTPKQKDIDSGTWSTSASGNESSVNSSRTKESGGGSDTYSVNDDNASVLNSDAVHEGRIHGNIGVKTTQSMALEELNLGYWNIYTKITELFLQEFTIPVYS